jgi:DNA-binding GntR family transcriptional regulator
VARCIVGMLGAAANGTTKQEIQISQEELGRLAGTSRQRVNYAVQRLKQEQLLSTDYRRIKVVDIDRLRAFAS